MKDYKVDIFFVRVRKTLRREFPCEFPVFMVLEWDHNMSHGGKICNRKLQYFWLTWRTRGQRLEKYNYWKVKEMLEKRTNIRRTPKFFSYTAKVSRWSLNCLWVVLVTQSCLILFNPMDCNPMEFSRQGYWSGLPFPSHPRDKTQVSCIAGRLFIIWATREACE